MYCIFCLIIPLWLEASNTDLLPKKKERILFVPTLLSCLTSGRVLSAVDTFKAHKQLSNPKCDGIWRFLGLDEGTRIGPL
jgi:hypothetical protein